MKTLLSGIALLCSLGVCAQQVPKGLTASNGVYIGFYEYVPADYDPAVKYPLIVFLHGIGERGNGTTELSRVLANGIPQNINAGHKMRFFWNGKWQTFIVLTPQLSGGYGWWQSFYVDEMMKYAKQNYNIDTNRIILTGLSLGGGGTWDYMSQPDNPKRFSAMGVSCGTCQTLNYCNISNANLPTWAFHAQDDGTVGVGCTTGAISNINACNPAVKPYMTIWPTGGHSIWGRVFDTGYTWQNPNIYEWFLGQDKSLPVNKRPVANAGPNVTISTVAGMVNLSGALSTDADGTIQRYIWRKLSGPAAGTINTPVSVAGRTSVTGLTIAGTYQYEVKVVDDRADWTFDTVTVTVAGTTVPNIPPVTEAGSDQLTATSVAVLNGNNSYDPDGTVVSYKWNRISGPAVYTISDNTAATPSLSGLLIGTYQFELETTDNVGAKTTDTVAVLSDLTVLPVKFLYFKGNNAGNRNQLFWATERELDNDHFDIEKSADGIHFTTLSTQRAGGKKISTQEYTFTDENISGNKNYYRLKQVSTSGAVEYTGIVLITGTTTQTPVSVTCFPNPAPRSIAVQADNEARGITYIRIYSLDGKLLLQQQAMKLQERLISTLNIELLNKGIYMLEVTTGEAFREVQKIVKQ